MTLTRVVPSLALGVALVACVCGAACAESPSKEGGDPAQEGPAQTTEGAGHGEQAHGAHAPTGPHPLEVEKNPLEFKKELAIWTAVVFLLLLAVLWKFAWGPIVQGLDRREQGIADQIDQADQANQRAKDLLTEYEKKLGGAKDDVRGILAQGRRNAEQVSREMLDQAKEAAKAEQQRAAQQIDVATDNAIKELAELSANLAVELAGKIVRTELKPDDHAGLIQQTMANFGRQTPSDN